MVLMREGMPNWHIDGAQNNIVVSFNAHLFSLSCESLFIKCENRQYKHLSIYFIFSFFHRITCRSHGKLEEELFSINPLHDLLGCFISSSIVLDALFANFFPLASAAVKFCSATYKFSSWQKKPPTSHKNCPKPFPFITTSCKPEKCT